MNMNVKAEMVAGQIAPHAVSTIQADRWIYAGIAALFFVTALVGFIPSSLDKMASVQAGQRPAFPLLVHAHAVLMGSWLALLVVQSVLVASGKTGFHRRLGMVAFWHVPVLVLLMILMTRYGWESVLHTPPSAMPPEALAGLKAFFANLLLGQVAVIVLFPVFVFWALRVRRTDPESHKRLMLFATLLPLLAAVDRATGRWGVSSAPMSGDSLYAWALVLMLPALAHDLIRLGRIHRAHLACLAALAAVFTASHFLWGSPTWQATAPRIMGLLGIQGW
jgi:hypothetical protein